MRTKENMHRPKYYTNASVREKVDKVLHKCALLFCNVGTGTPLDVGTREKAKKLEQKYLKEIKEYDESLYKRLSLSK